jgi:predicted site-specific integrase-resolvase
MRSYHRMTRGRIWNGMSKCWSLLRARQGWTLDVVADLGSGMNYQKKGLKRLLSGILDGQVGASRR